MIRQGGRMQYAPTLDRRKWKDEYIECVLRHSQIAFIFHWQILKSQLTLLNTKQNVGLLIFDQDKLLTILWKFFNQFSRHPSSANLFVMTLRNKE
jgi:hypothetical protein